MGSSSNMLAGDCLHHIPCLQAGHPARPKRPVDVGILPTFRTVRLRNRVMVYQTLATVQLLPCASTGGQLQPLPAEAHAEPLEDHLPRTLLDTPRDERREPQIRSHLPDSLD